MWKLLVFGALLLPLTGCLAEASRDTEDGAGAAPVVADRQEIGLTLAASGTVIEPHFAAWSLDGSGLYVVSPLAVHFLSWDSDDVRELATLSPSEQLMGLSSRGDIAMLQADGTVVLRNAESGAELAVVAAGAPVSSVRFSPDGGLVAVVAGEGSRLLLWDVDRDSPVRELIAPPDLTRAYSVEFSADGDSLAWFSPEAAVHFDLATGALGPLIRFGAPLSDVELMADGRLLVAGGSDLAVWDAPAGALLTTHPADAQLLAVESDATTGQVLLTTDHGIELLAPDLGAGLASQPMVAYDALFAPSGDALGVVGADGSVAIWTLG